NPTSVNRVNYGIRGFHAENPYYGFDGGQSSLYIRNGHTTQTNTMGGITKLSSNYSNPGPFPVAVQFNGLTKAITFDISGLTPGATYTFKIAIGEVGDGTMDSGVFVR